MAGRSNMRLNYLDNNFVYHSGDREEIPLQQGFMDGSTLLCKDRINKSSAPKSSSVACNQNNWRVGQRFSNAHFNQARVERRLIHKLLVP